MRVERRIGDRRKPGPKAIILGAARGVEGLRQVGNVSSEAARQRSRGNLFYYPSGAKTYSHFGRSIDP